GIVFILAHLCERAVHAEFIAPVAPVPGPDLPGLRGDRVDARTGRLERALRLCELDLLEPVRHEGGDPQAVELLCHGGAPLEMSVGNVVSFPTNVSRAVPPRSRQQVGGSGLPGRAQGRPVPRMARPIPGRDRAQAAFSASCFSARQMASTWRWSVPQHPPTTASRGRAVRRSRYSRPSSSGLPVSSSGLLSSSAWLRFEALARRPCSRPSQSPPCRRTAAKC